MSWAQRKKAFEALDALTAVKNPPLKEVLDSDYITAALTQRLPNLTNYLYAHIQDIVNVAVGLDPVLSQEQYSLLCMELLTKQCSPLLEKLLKDGIVISFLVTCLFSPSINFRPTIQLLHTVFEKTKGRCLYIIKDPLVLIEFLLDHCNLLIISDFTEFIFSMHSPDLSDWLGETEIDQFLLNYVKKSSFPHYLCQFMGLKCLHYFSTQTVGSPAAWARLTSAETLKVITDIAIHHDQPQICLITFQFLLRLFDDQQGTIQSVTNFLFNYLDDFAKIIMSFNAFSNQIRWVTDLFGTCIAWKGQVPPIAVQLVSHLWPLIFEFPTNTFLQNAFFNLFQAISYYDEDFFQVCDALNFPDALVHILENKKPSTVYWGMLNQLAKLVYEKAEEMNCFGDHSPEDLDEKGLNSFCTFYHEKIAPSLEACSHSYGGDLPSSKTRKDQSPPSEPEEQLAPSSLYQCNFVDSCDLNAFNFQLDEEEEKFEEEQEEEQEHSELRLGI